MCVCMCICNLEHEHIECALKIANSIWACEHAGLTWWLSGKESTCNAGDADLIPGLEDSPGEGNGNPLQYSWPGKSHGQRSLADYRPWGRKRVRHNWATKQYEHPTAGFSLWTCAFSQYEEGMICQGHIPFCTCCPTSPQPASISRCWHRLQQPQSQPWNLQAFCNCGRKLYFIALASAVTFKWNSFAFHSFFFLNLLLCLFNVFPLITIPSHIHPTIPSMGYYIFLCLKKFRHIP